jgi:hypothetical protein
MEDSKMSIENKETILGETPEDIIEIFFNELKSSQFNNNTLLLPNETFLDKKNLSIKPPIRTSTIVRI